MAARPAHFQDLRRRAGKCMTAWDMTRHDGGMNVQIGEPRYRIPQRQTASPKRQGCCREE